MTVPAKAEVIDRDSKSVTIRCPECNKRAILRLKGLSVAHSTFDVLDDGMVYPDFVCMQQNPSGKYCKFGGPIQI
jgi:hypothetical protein